jgi:putative membrane protein
MACQLLRRVEKKRFAFRREDMHGKSNNPFAPMTQLLISWLVLSLAFWLTAMLLPGFHVKSFGSAVFVAAIFGIINALLGWLFFGVLTIATLGIAWLLSFITRWFINAVFLSITDKLTSGLKIDGFRWALAGSLAISLVGAGIDWALRAVFA